VQVHINMAFIVGALFKFSKNSQLSMIIYNFKTKHFLFILGGCTRSKLKTFKTMGESL